MSRTAADKPSSPTALISDFVANIEFAQIPESVVALAKKSILDALGVGIAGAASDGATILREHAASYESRGTASVIGTLLRTAPSLAALVNGTAVHADDYDDTLRSSVTEVDKGSVHPTGPIFSAVLSVAEPAGLSGRETLAAYLAGVEAVSAVADAMGPRHFRAGFHGTATCVSLGAAAGVARALRLSQEQTRIALGIAASSAGGLRENFGSMVKPLHAGRAAETGVVSAQLAARGFTASESILEASRGFFSAYGDGHDPAWIEGRLGDPWAFDDPGVWIKPFPSGMRTHPGMSKLQDMMAQYRFGAADIRSLRVRTNQTVFNTLLHHRPVTGLQGKFSMEFCLAVILADGTAGLSIFDDEVVQRADIQALIRKIDYAPYSDEEAAAEGYSSVTTLLDVTTNDGRYCTARADYCKGSLDDPMSYDEVAAKIEECSAARGWSRSRSAALSETVARLETISEIGDLTRLLVPEG